ncbi:hypothetical protein LCGC14_1158390 [marine sediment metagenome]|uniref:HTH cro/C1-type domain-containing protein n=1 Tax=marine sediment metagenome TaxID=412755 RepID=A0A0F9LYF9_9ZZZZ
MDSRELGVRIRDHRKKRGLTLVELANQIGVSQSFLSMVENAKTTPSLENLVAIGEVLRWDWNYLIEGVAKDGSPTEEEKQLLALWRRLAKRDKGLFLSMLDRLNHKEAVILRLADETEGEEAEKVKLWTLRES